MSDTKELGKLFDSAIDAFITTVDETYSQRMHNEANTGDTERDHVLADDILLELLRAMNLTKTADEFEAVNKWYA